MSAGHGWPAVCGARGPAGGLSRSAIRHAGARHPQRRSPTSSTLSTGAFTVCCEMAAYGRWVSSTMENRAAVFTNQPQAVEVYQAGAWWSGELLGWRHAGDGSCQVWVRVVLDGVEETAWTGLETLRLPERHLAMAPVPGSARPADRELSVARHPSSRREHRADAHVDSAGTASASLPTVRDLSVVPDSTIASAGGRRRAPDEPVATPGGGRRRAPEDSAPAASGGRRRAPESAAAAVPGGRRRAPEEVVSAPTGGRRRAPEDVASAAGPATPLVRRAVAPPAVEAGGPGRHRTADTGLFPAVSDATAALANIRRPAGPMAAGRGPVALSARPATPVGVGAGDPAGWSAPSGLDPEQLTRPMRLSDHIPHSRRPRLDRSRPGL